MITIKQDIKDSSGNLLYLAKGTKITLDEYNTDLFRRWGILHKVIEQNANDVITQNNYRDKIPEAFKNIINIEDIVELNNVVEQIAEILFNKSHSEYLYLNSLFNGIEWYYSHSINVAILSTLIGKKLMYSKERLEHLLMGALFHDIGVLLIPKNILLEKFDNLTDDDLRIFKSHCDLGVTLIDNISFPLISKTIINQHHELIDGSGYPNNLTEEAIIEEAQIVMIADTFDTDTSYRLVRNLKTLAESINDMLEQSHKYPEKYVMCLQELIVCD